MTSRISTSVPLTLAQTRSLADARALVAKSLAGRTRILAEMVTGASIVSGEQAAAAHNAQGLIGIDKSGPPFGSAWRHTMGTAGGIGDDTETMQVIQQRVTINDDGPVTRFHRIYVRPHALVEGAPYSRGYPLLRMKRQAIGVDDVNVSITLECNGEERTAVIAVDSTSLTYYGTTDAWWALKPGRNRLRITLSTTASIAAYLYQWSPANAVKRSHET